MLGFSLYFEKDENIIEKLNEYQGYDLFFTSLHYPSDDEIFKNFINLYQVSKDLDFDICVDINNETLEKFPQLADMDLILRLDFGFSIEKIKSLSKKTRLAINASTVNYQDLKKLSDNGVDMEQVIGWHNYYPLDFSALGRKYFQEQNNLFRKFNMKTAAFVPGDKNLRGPVYEGLPSLEDHRYQNPYISMVDLRRTYSIDICLQGEEVNHEDQVYIKNFFKKDLISLPVKFNEDFNYLDEIELRPDISDYILRNNRIKRDVPPLKARSINRGHILLCNNLSGRYAGEIEIARKDLGVLEDRNVVGRVDKRYLKLLDYIKGGDRIVFDRK